MPHEGSGRCRIGRVGLCLIEKLDEFLQRREPIGANARPATPRTGLSIFTDCTGFTSSGPRGSPTPIAGLMYRFRRLRPAPSILAKLLELNLSREPGETRLSR